MHRVLAACLFAVSPAAHAIAPYGGFPDVATAAVAGDTVLVPAWNRIEAGAGPDADKTGFVFYQQTLVAPGPTHSMYGHAGMLSVHAADECTPTPLKPTVAAGDTAWVEFAGSFVQAKVTRVDPLVGRVFVEQFGKERAIAFGDVMP